MDDSATTIHVVDFRRHSMVLQWHALGGTWKACDVPPALVHGVALIRPQQPNICVYAHRGRLRFQVGPSQYALLEKYPRITCSRGIASFGLRRRFEVHSATGALLFSHTYWTGRRRDFFRWLADHAGDPNWRSSCARHWSDGLAPSALRQY